MPSFPGAIVEVSRASDEGESLDVPSKGDVCQNGPPRQFPDPLSSPGPTTSPLGPDASPGVAGFHDNLRKSQGTSAEGNVRKEALQSLRLSLPMQETQLCKHLFPPGFSLLSPNPPPVSLVTHHPSEVHALTGSLLVSLPFSVLSRWWVVHLTNSSILERKYTSSWSDIDSGAQGPDLKGLYVHVSCHPGW